MNRSRLASQSLGSLRENVKASDIIEAIRLPEQESRTKRELEGGRLRGAGQRMRMKGKKEVREEKRTLLVATEGDNCASRAEVAVRLDPALSPRYVTASGGHVLVEGLEENVALFI